MARVSFTLRRPESNPDLGSYLRFEDGEYTVYSAGGASTGASVTRVDYDSSLRADGLQIAPAEFEEFFFNAVSTCYGEVDLDWGVNIATTLTAEPQVMGVVLVYSPLGEPQTVASGDILVDSSSTYEHGHTGLTPGRWAYYTLFMHYRSSGGDNYYEKAASLAVLVPRDYGSTLMLWERIPEYYRNQDLLLGTAPSTCLGSHLPAGGVVGPFFRYLSIIGFEIDKLRTLIDYTMEAKDPYLANSETLDAIADLVAIQMRSNDLGGARLRNLINDVGYFRRSKGTEDAISYFAKAVSGCDISIDQVLREIVIYSQRVNYFQTPKSGASSTNHRAAYDSESSGASVSVWSDTSAAAYDGHVLASGSQYTTSGTGASVGINSARFRMTTPIPVKLNDHVFFSVHSGQGTSALKWVRLTDATGADQIGISTNQVTTGGVTSYEVVANTNASAGVFTDAYLEFHVDLAQAGTFGFTSVLLERNHKGDYFDGDTVMGGWLVDASSISDFRWAGSADNSHSLFTEDYERTKSILDAVLFDVFPITEASLYTITVYNGIPGVD